MTSRRRALIESLETRRLLAVFSVFGTNGPDTIDIDYTSSGGIPTYSFIVNGVNQGGGGGSALGNSIEVSGLDGNDVIRVLHEHFNDTIDVHPGEGDDQVVVANGDFGNDIDGTVNVIEQAGASNDSLQVFDAFAGSGQHDTIHISANQLYADETATIDATVTWNGNIEGIDLRRSLRDDVVYVDAPTANFTLELGTGSNIVNYGGSSHVLFGTVTPMTVVGGAGVDKIVFDDSNGGTNQQTYNFTPTSALNQTLSLIDQIDLNTRGASLNFVNFSGDPTTRTLTSLITINGTSTSNISFGSAATPIPSDPNVKINIGGKVSYFMNTATGSTSNESLYGYPSIDNVLHFRNMAVSGSIAADLFIQGGAGSETFNVSQTPTNSKIKIDGGPGADSCLFGVAALDSVLKGTSFEFVGGADTDLIRLDDGGDAIGDGDSDYTISDSHFSKSNGLRVDYNYTTELLDVTLDSDNNMVIFADAPQQHLAIDGNGGNDQFYTPNPTNTALASSIWNVTLIANAGNDSLHLYDLVAPSDDQYTIDTDTLTFVNGGTDTHTLEFYQFENFWLDECSAGGTTTISALPPSMNTTVNGNGGNDTFVVGGGDLDTNGFNSLTIKGGTGTDSVHFDDHLDRYSSSEDELVQLNGAEVDKGAVTIAFTEFESMQFEASSTITGPVDFNPAEVVNLNTCGGIPTTIFAAFNRNTTVNVGNPTTGLLAPIDALVTLTMGGAGGAVINDQGGSGNTGYTLTSTQLTASTGKTIHYSGGGITLNANNGLNSITLRSSTAFQPFVINGYGGDDLIALGNGNLDTDFHSNVTVNGGTGTDSLILDNTADTTLESQTLDSGVFIDGQSFFFSSIESLQPNAGPGGGTVNINTLSTYMLMQGNSGVDTANVGTGNLDATLLADMRIDNFDLVTLDDHSTAPSDIYYFTSGSFHKNNTGHTVSLVNAARTVLQGNDSSNMINVSQFGTPLSIFGNGGSDTLNISGTLIGFNIPNVTFDGGAALDTINLSNTGSPGTAYCTLAANYQDLLDVNVAVGGTLTIPTQSVADVTNGFSLTGVVDMAGGALIYRHGGSQSSLFNTRIKNGFANGAWNGTTSPSINSSLAASTPIGDAVGFGSALTVLGPSGGTFAGRSVNANDMLVRYTLYGDANLDAKVDIGDLGVLASNWQGTGKFWAQGDFNFSNTVDVADLGLLASNWQSQLSASAFAPSNVIGTSAKSGRVIEQIEVA